MAHIPALHDHQNRLHNAFSMRNVHQFPPLQCMTWLPVHLIRKLINRVKLISSMAQISATSDFFNSVAPDFHLMKTNHLPYGKKRIIMSTSKLPFKIDTAYTNKHNHHHHDNHNSDNNRQHRHRHLLLLVALVAYRQQIRPIFSRKFTLAWNHRNVWLDGKLSQHLRKLRYIYEFLQSFALIIKSPLSMWKIHNSVK